MALPTTPQLKAQECEYHQQLSLELPQVSSTQLSLILCSYYLINLALKSPKEKLFILDEFLPDSVNIIPYSQPRRHFTTWSTPSCKRGTMSCKQ